MSISFKMVFLTDSFSILIIINVLFPALLIEAPDKYTSFLSIIKNLSWKELFLTTVRLLYSLLYFSISILLNLLLSLVINVILQFIVLIKSKNVISAYSSTITILFLALFSISKIFL